MYDIFKNKIIIVTGSTGFKGSWLCFWLKKLGAKVVGIGLKPEKGSVIFKSLNLHKEIEQNYINICEFEKLNKIIKKIKPEIIFHLAAQSVVSESYHDPLFTLNTNIIGSANILEACRKNKIKNLIYITSDKCYLNKEFKKGYKEEDELGGLDNYSSSKAAAEIIFKSYYESYFKNLKNLSTVSARAGNVIGGGDFKKNRIVPDVIKSFNSNKILYLRSPLATRPWQHVLEPLNGYLKLAELILSRKLKHNLIPNWNFGPNRKNCKNVRQIVDMIAKEWGVKPKIINLSKEKRFKETNLLSLNIKKAEKELNWKPKLNMQQTIKLTVEWYKNFFKEKNMKEISNNQIEMFEEL